jgi:hypothetical protein
VAKQEAARTLGENAAWKRLRGVRGSTRKFAAMLAVDAAERHVLFMRIVAISVVARYVAEIVAMTGVVRS